MTGYCPWTTGSAGWMSDVQVIVKRLEAKSGNKQCTESEIPRALWPGEIRDECLFPKSVRDPR